MQISLRRPQDRDQLDRLIARERGAKQRDRYRAVCWALEGLSAQAVGDKIGRTGRFVQRWAYAYRDGGIDAIAAKPQPGRPTKLPRDREAAFKQRLGAGPLPGADGGLCTLRGKDAVRILKREFGVGYSLGGAISLLHRLGLSCLKPRPRHRKNDPEAMAKWKQDAPLWLKTSAVTTPPRPSKFGSRTKPASASRAR